MSNFFTKQILIAIIVIGIIGMFDVHNVHASTIGTIDSSNHNAYVCYEISCTEHGTINFLPSGGVSQAQIVDTNVMGYAWGDNLGWINFHPTGSGVTYASSTGELSGYAWSESSGWINFRPSNSGTLSLGIPVGVSINGSNEWYGWAFANGKNGGWVKFDCSSVATCVKVVWGTSTEPVVITPPVQTTSSGGYFVNNTNMVTTTGTGTTTPLVQSDIFSATTTKNDYITTIKNTIKKILPFITKTENNKEKLATSSQQKSIPRAYDASPSQEKDNSFSSSTVMENKNKSNNPSSLDGVENNNSNKVENSNNIISNNNVKIQLFLLIGVLISFAGYFLFRFFKI